MKKCDHICHDSNQLELNCLACIWHTRCVAARKAYPYRLKGSKYCMVTGCDNKLLARGVCDNHYHKLKIHGDPHVSKAVRGENRSKHPLYNTYNKMKQRCYNATEPGYQNYGGRGIAISNRWLGLNGFSNFVKDMGDKPPGMSVDRINNDGDYSPDNCRWATRHQQLANTRSNKKFVGVTWTNRGERWRALLRVNGKIYQKTFKEYEDAVQYRKKLEEQYLQT